MRSRDETLSSILLILFIVALVTVGCFLWWVVIFKTALYLWIIIGSLGLAAVIGLYMWSRARMRRRRKARALREDFPRAVVAKEHVWPQEKP